MLPNFICVGAQKAGSSSLYKLLRSHPEVHVSQQKELHFFNIDENYEKGLEHYEEFFKDGYQSQKHIGEFTPDYLQYSFVPTRIKKILGNIKVLIILRHPVERAYSQFNFHRMLGHEKMNSDFEEVLENEEVVLGVKSRESWFWPAYYKSKSLYYNQIKRYVDTFGRDNVHLIVFEEMIKDRNKPNLIATCKFLDIDENHEFLSNHSNPTVLNFHSGYMERLRSIKNKLLKIFPEEYINPIKDAIIRRSYKKPPKLVKEVKEKLYEKYFLEDVKKIERDFGVDLSIWDK